MMDNCFEIPVSFQSAEYQFPAELIAYGYSYKIEVQVGEHLVVYERDEAQEFRAMIPFDELEKSPAISKPLLEAIAIELTGLFKD